MTTCAWKNIGCSLQNILPSSWKRIVESWLREDVPSLDYGGFVVGEKPETAVLYGKSEVKGRKNIRRKQLMCFYRECWQEFLFLRKFSNNLSAGNFFHVLKLFVFKLSNSVEWCLKEGENINPVMKVAIVRGPAKNILLGERISLNIISRCSGIATKLISCEYLRKK